MSNCRLFITSFEMNEIDCNRIFSDQYVLKSTNLKLHFSASWYQLKFKPLCLLINSPIYLPRRWKKRERGVKSSFGRAWRACLPSFSAVVTFPLAATRQLGEWSISRLSTLCGVRAQNSIGKRESAMYLVILLASLMAGWNALAMGEGMERTFGMEEKRF